MDDSLSGKAAATSASTPPHSRPSLFPDGHFYSPVVNPESLSERRNELWPATLPQTPGIDLNDTNHLNVLRNWFPKFIGDYDYPDHADPLVPTRYFSLNDQFAWLDSRALFVFLRELRPQRAIEVGSGFSSLLIADVNRRYLDGKCEFTCIEPYPRQFLRDGVPGISRLIEQRAECVDRNIFAVLQPGDILFIDSSHVAKTGSDVLFLLFEILPTLKPGVIVHVHDIFLPEDYPELWAIDENRSWNEQYVLRALLMYSTRFRVLFGCTYAASRYGAEVVQALARPDGHGMSGGSFWIEVI